ncbi:MAG: flavin reductase family protein [Candidatus Bathyarchaeia archaeon]
MTDVVGLSIDDDTLRLFGFSPVTLITTVGKDGSVNAAPHSRSTVADYNPPQILVSVNTKHDTYRNIIETKEFVINIPGVDLLRQIWIAQKHFPYGTSELEQAKLTAFPAEKVSPPRIKECKAFIECRVLWTKIINSSCLALGNVEAISAKREMEELDVKERAIALNRLIFFSYRREENVRRWMFAEMGKIHILTEEDGEVKVKSETI